VLRGRECGRSRLSISATTVASDWVIQEAQSIAINGNVMTTVDATEFLSEQRTGVVDVVLANEDVKREFQFIFTLADKDDLEGVDVALGRLIDSGELSSRSIDDFIMQSKPYPTGAPYLAGLANYLYGVVAREGNHESLDKSCQVDYQAKYDQAVGALGTFDRAPAEAICGIVAFHYNQFDRALTKTKSQRVADVSARFQAMIKGGTWSNGDLSLAPHSSLDFTLSDSVIERVLNWSAIPLFDGPDSKTDELIANIDSQRPYDALKLRLIAAERCLVVADRAAAMRHADALRNSRAADLWYVGFRNRVQGGSRR
jgi:hypothetical protein